MEEVLAKIGEIGVVPVVAIRDAGDAVPLGEALLAGDLPLAEITFRTDAAEQAIRSLSRALPELLVGAGTVLTVDQVKRARDAGARFMVSPGFNPRVVDYCLEQSIPVTPGVNSPTTVEMALERGLRVLKFFPAEASGGLPMLKAMAGPYGGVSFIPTGGVSTGNLQSYLASGLVHACGGTWIAKADMIAAKNFAEITRLAREAVSLTLGFALKRVGLSEAGAVQAAASARLLGELLFLPLVETRNGQGKALFSGGGFEISASEAGSSRIVLSTLSLPRALSYLKRKAVGMTEVAEKQGRPVSVLLEAKIAGLAVRLEQA